MNGGSVVFAKMTPFTTPETAPAAKPAARQTPNGSPAKDKYEATMPAMAITAPTDKSMPPIISTMVMAQAMIMLTDTCRATLIRLAGVRNVGDAMASTTNKIIRKAN